MAETWQGGKVSDRSAGALWTRFELTYPEWKDLGFTDGPADLDEMHSGLRVPRFLDYSRDELIRGPVHNPHDRKGGGLQNDGSVLGGNRRRILM